MSLNRELFMTIPNLHHIRFGNAIASNYIKMKLTVLPGKQHLNFKLHLVTSLHFWKKKKSFSVTSTWTYKSYYGDDML